MGHTHLLWKELDRKEVYGCRVFSVMDVQSAAPDGSIGIYSVLDAPDWAIVVPVIEAEDGDRFLMVRQWRHGSRNLSVEFPGGVLEKGEDVEAAAKRELLEETGWSAGKFTKLGSFNPNPAIMSNWVHIFAAGCLTRSGDQDLDHDEYVDVVQVPVAEAVRGMGAKPYDHALMASALMLYLRLGRGA